MLHPLPRSEHAGSSLHIKDNVSSAGCPANYNQFRREQDPDMNLRLKSHYPAQSVPQLQVALVK